MLARNVLFRIKLLKEIRKGYDHALIKYFIGVSVVHLAASQSQLICDVRTANVNGATIRRFFFNSVLFLELLTFRNKTIISACLADKMGYRNYHILPLGGNKIAIKKKRFDAFHLLYVGTLDGRMLEDTVRGFGIFHAAHHKDIRCTYTIIGTGRASEIGKIQRAIDQYQLKAVVRLAGYVNHEALTPYLQQANIGVAYVPVTGFFDCQPPTKTYEYLLSGMAVLATGTKENRRIVDDSNGVIIRDDAESVAEGLESLLKNRLKYDSHAIQNGMETYTWKNITLNNLHPYLRLLRQHNGLMKVY
jgi:glycosyltransferase involved in cell wall biosynthesis